MRRGIAAGIGLLMIMAVLMGLGGCQSGNSHPSQVSGNKHSDAETASDRGATGDRYLIGVGIYDITGPAAVGRYLIRYHGDYKTKDGQAQAFQGASHTFTLK